MTSAECRESARRATLTFLIAALVCALIPPQQAAAYVLNHTVPAAGGCPQRNAQPSTSGSIDRRWNPTLGSNILTVNTGAARTNEVEQEILTSFATWASVGAGLNSNSYASLVRIANPGSNDCNAFDTFNTICFNQSASFSSNVLAFTTSVTSDIPNETFGNKTATFLGFIFDADVLFNPAFQFATPGALPLNSTAFDLQSVLTHELGHFLGFSHSGIVRAMMYPFAPPRGTFLGDRPTMANPTGPLAEDDRAGLRVIYPNPADTTNIGVISGRVTPANPISNASAAQPSPGPLTGIFGTHVVAVDAATGEVVAGTLGGWSCNPASPPTQFDGFYEIRGLPVNRSYKIYVEPFDLPVDASNIRNALSDLCRSNVVPACNVPRDASGNEVVNTNFTTRTKP